MDLTKQMDLTEQIEHELKEKSNDVKRMVLKALESLLDMRNDPNFYEKTFLLFKPLTEFIGEEKESLVLVAELENIALSFSGLTLKEVKKFESFLQKEIAKLAPSKSQSLKAFMHRSLNDVVTAAPTSFYSSYPKTTLKAFLTVIEGFYDESFQLTLTHPVKDDPEKKQLADRIYKLLSEYCKIQNMQITLLREPQFRITPVGEVYEMLIWGERQEEGSVQRSQIFVTVASDRILISRKDFVH